MTICGVFAGGVLVNKFGILNSLIFSGFLQIVSNLLYVLLAKSGPMYDLLILTVAGENFSGGMGFSSLCGILVSFMQ